MHLPLALTLTSHACRYANEWNYAVVDDATRLTGRIVKITRAFSVDGLKLGMLNFKLARWDAEKRAEAQDLYPQMLGHLYFCNGPPSLRWVWLHIIQPLLPKRVREKTGILDTLHKPDDMAKMECFMRRELLPAFLGGDARLWPPSLEDIDKLPVLGNPPFRRYD